MTEEELLKQPDDAYMNEAQRAFFQQLLLDQRRELQARLDEEFAGLRSFEPSSDPADAGATEEQRQAHLRFLERERKLLDKIDYSLDLITRGEYGWCEETGDPIGLTRLLLRPTATLSFEAKERQETFEKHLRHRSR